MSAAWLNPQVITGASVSGVRCYREGNDDLPKVNSRDTSRLREVEYGGPPPPGYPYRLGQLVGHQHLSGYYRISGIHLDQKGNCRVSVYQVDPHTLDPVNGGEIQSYPPGKLCFV